MTKWKRSSSIVGRLSIVSKTKNMREDVNDWAVRLNDSWDSLKSSLLVIVERGHVVPMRISSSLSTAAKRKRRISFDVLSSRAVWYESDTELTKGGGSRWATAKRSTRRRSTRETP